MSKGLQINRAAVATMSFKEFEKHFKTLLPNADMRELYKQNGGKEPTKEVKTSEN